ncbi:dephospho-CoA kinase [Chitinibacter sp. SCUT-21]|uniref:dephospho-CoA kinase n=1 Tax=Chitinibacter sp. SCUT-21 TaxID=2970891 RepID=UPI0035A5DD3E
MIVGLTGGIGSGKSTAAEYFARLGIHIVDTDLISHQLTQADQPILTAISAHFGTNCLNADGALNRAWLRQEIHTNPNKKKVLESILYPKILAKCIQELNEYTTDSYQILMVPLLFENAAFKNLCQQTITVECEQEVRIARVMQRSHLTHEGVVAIINNQLTDAERRQQAHHLIYNNGSLASLEQQVITIDSLLRDRCNTLSTNTASQF